MGAQESRRRSVAVREAGAGMPPEASLAHRVVIEGVQPSIDGGRFPVKRTVGESVVVSADIFADGHDVIVALLCDRHLAARTGVRSEESAAKEPAWRETRMAQEAAGSDRWSGAFEVDVLGWHEYSLLAWVDRFQTWKHDLRIKARVGQDISVELLEGALLVREAAGRADAIGRGFGNADSDIDWLLAQADALSDGTPLDERVEIALGDELSAVMAAYPDRSAATASARFRVWVDRERARFGAWYEMFPRSAGRDASRSATFRGAAARLPVIADLGFDVLYLPPIHPIGSTFRKGPNNTVGARAGDPGSPWAIGAEAGGHTAVEPGLGTIDDFVQFRKAAERCGLEIALDLAFQCSPDHPWVHQHPEWFRHRPDGTIKYAENPPKKYQDIYPLDFACDDWRALWRELLAVVMFWIDRGVSIFRVDNPHTKTFGFWEWLIGQVHEHHPDVLFLSEAFTRPAPMRYLAKSGFTQSYTYFTWRNSKQELIDYFTELTGTEVREYLRPNLFANTPDILHEYLQRGGRPAFEARLLLAATLGASYGIYSGFELCEADAVLGTEEYLHSEKYEIRPRDWTRPGNINELIAKVNTVRRRHAALQQDSSLRFCSTDNPELVAYTKASPDGDLLLTVVNLDPHHLQHGFVEAPFSSDRYSIRDLLDGAVYQWRRGWNYVRLEPGVKQGHILMQVA